MSQASDKAPPAIDQPAFDVKRALLKEPDLFRRTMTEVDHRLPEMTQGLGVLVGDRSRYYPLTKIPEGGIEDHWDGRKLEIRRGELDGVPRAAWRDSGERPFQMLSRWHGFALTFPGCEIWDAP